MNYSEKICIFFKVLNFKWVFFKLNRFICNWQLVHMSWRSQVGATNGFFLSLNAMIDE